MLGKTINESVTGPSIDAKDKPDHNEIEKGLNTSSCNKDLVEVFLSRASSLYKKVIANSNTAKTNIQIIVVLRDSTHPTILLA